MARQRSKGAGLPGKRRRLQLDITEERIQKLNELGRQLGTATWSETIRRLIDQGAEVQAPAQDLSRALEIIETLAKKIPDVKSG